MADRFNTLVSQASAPGGPSSFGSASMVTPKTVSSGADTALAGLGILIEGTGKIMGDVEKREVAKDVDATIEATFQEAFDIAPGSSIDTALNRLSMLKEAAGQGKSTADRFNLVLMQKAKELKTQHPERIAAIDKAMRDRGLVDPAVALFAEQGAREKAREMAQIGREEKAVSEMVSLGAAVYSIPGDPSSPVDRKATIKLAHDHAVKAQQKAQTLAQLGIKETSTGDIKETLRFDYLKAVPQLREAMWSEVMVGIRPIMNNVSKLIKDNADINVVKAELDKAIAMKDRFLLQKKSEGMVLNRAEQDDYNSFANDLVNTVFQGVVDMKDAKDLNMMKSSVWAFDNWSKNADILNATTAPILMRISRVSRDMGSTIVNRAQFSEPGLVQSMKKVGGEVKDLIDWTPSKPDPKPEDVPEPGSAENNLSEGTKAYRRDVAIKSHQDWIDQGITIQKSADAYTWLQTQSPLYNAYVQGQLSPNDVRTLAKQLTTSNYLLNLGKAKEFMGPAAGKYGAYAFDIVQQNVMNNIREMRGSGMDQGDLKVVFNQQAKKFEVVLVKPNQEQTGDRIGLGIQEPSARELLTMRGGNAFARLEEINKSLPALLSMKEFKEAAKGMSERDFITQMGNDMNSLFGVQPEGGSSNEQLPFSPKGDGYDLERAKKAGMKPAGPEAGENEGHMGSVVETTPEEKEKYNLPEESYIILKGASHPTFNKAVKAENERGFVVVKKEDRYFSVPKENDVNLQDKATIWGVAYQGMDDPDKKKTFVRNVQRYKKDANPAVVDTINKVVYEAFDGDEGVSTKVLADMMVDIALHESSGFKEKVQRGGGPARGIHQVEPETAIDLLQTSTIIGPKAKNILKRNGLDVDGAFSLTDLENALLKDEVSTVFATAKLLSAAKHSGQIERLK